MQEIAQATYNFQDFNEIMPTIFRRFVEKEAHDWRQIYKVRHTHTHTHIQKCRFLSSNNDDLTTGAPTT